MAKKQKRLKILLAVDDSTYSAAARELLVRLTSPEQCEVRVIHVVEPLDRAFYPELTTAFPTSLAEIQKDRLQHGKAIVENALAQVQKAGYKATGILGRGHIRSTLVEAAEKWSADIILLGNRGRTGLKRTLLGSVSDHVARHAHCSVLIVR